MLQLTYSDARQLNGIMQISVCQAEEKGGGARGARREGTGVLGKHTCGTRPSPLLPRQLLSGQMRAMEAPLASGGSSYLISGSFYHLIPDASNLSHFMDGCQWC